MNQLLLAIQFLTRLPVPRNLPFSPDALVASARWFPLVGVLVGGCVVLAAYLGGQIDPWLGAWLGLIVWVWVTGGLHLDGLADLADGLGAAHRDTSRLLAVMKDPHLGSFGVLALIVQTSGKLVLLMLLVKQHALIHLIWIAAWARLGPLFWQSLPPLVSGMAEAFSWRIPKLARLLWGVGLMAAGWMYPALWLAPLLIALYRVWLERRLGGVSGDCLGAGIECVETGLMLAVASGPLILSLTRLL
ncbi:adenosylcobinamide-GDP ribazoletransferase [Burkholderiaceae bacterium DAT-1]|nr:adenosylcobinamide-GDP ribazoletransferase [Burkholderiaceae bacterium DAT-1]